MSVTILICLVEELLEELTLVNHYLCLMVVSIKISYYTSYFMHWDSFMNTTEWIVMKALKFSGITSLQVNVVLISDSEKYYNITINFILYYRFSFVTSNDVIVNDCALKSFVTKISAFIYNCILTFFLFDVFDLTEVP